MGKLVKLLNHRDFIILLSFIAGLLLGEKIRFLSQISMITLGIVMVAATSGFSF
ncbi:MAG: hypothetical protein M0R21_08350 [Lentimicrobiaceae bacterium]|jgi:predicted transcriptional regulator with HTH domain|nr:hypothetical protein [Lentimicrobiaceae bacterium]